MGAPYQPIPRRRDALRLEVAQLSEALEFERGSQREELREERNALKVEIAWLRDLRWRLKPPLFQRLPACGRFVYSRVFARCVGRVRLGAAMAIQPGSDVNAMAAQIIEWEKAMDERDALKAEVAQLRDENSVMGGRARRAEELALSIGDERNALRAKLEKVLAECEPYQSMFRSEDDSGPALSDAILAIINDENAA